VELDLHLEVAPDMSVVEAHALARQIAMELKVKFPEVSDVIIHIEPKTQTGAQPDPETTTTPSKRGPN